MVLLYQSVLSGLLIGFKSKITGYLGVYLRYACSLKYLVYAACLIYYSLSRTARTYPLVGTPKSVFLNPMSPLSKFKFHFVEENVLSPGNEK